MKKSFATLILFIVTDLPLLAIAQESDVNSRLDQHETRMNTIEQNIDSLTLEQKAEGDKIVWIDGSTVRAHDRINGLDDKTNTTNNAVLNLNTTQAAQSILLIDHQSQIKNNAQDLIDTNIRIDNIKTELDTKANNDTLANINGNISHVAQNVAIIEGGITQLQNRTASTEARATTLEAQATATDAQMAKTEARTTTLEAQATATDAQMAKTEARTTTLEAQATVTDAQMAKNEARTTTLEAQAAATDAQVAKTEARTTTLEAQATATDAQVAKTKANTEQIENRTSTLEARTTETEYQTSNLKQTQATTRRQVETNRQEILRIGSSVDKAVTLNNEAYQNRASENQRTEELNNTIHRVDQAAIDRSHRALEQSKQYTDQKTAELRSKINDVRSEERAGIASIAALSSVPTIAGKTFNVGVGIGNFKNSTAVAIGMHYQLSDHNVFRLGVATANSTDPVIGAGYSYGW